MTNFSTGFKGAPPARQRRASARRDRRERELAEREGVDWDGQHHQADGVGGKGGGLSAPEASAKAAPSRVRTLPGAAADAGPLSPLPPGRWWTAVTQHPAPRHARPRGPVLRAGHRLAAQDHRQGRACGASVAAQPQTLEQ